MVSKGRGRERAVFSASEALRRNKCSAASTVSSRILRSSCAICHFFSSAVNLGSAGLAVCFRDIFPSSNGRHINFRRLFASDEPLASLTTCIPISVADLINSLSITPDDGFGSFFCFASVFRALLSDAELFLVLTLFPFGCGMEGIDIGVLLEEDCVITCKCGGEMNFVAEVALVTLVAVAVLLAELPVWRSEISPLLLIPPSI